MNSLSPALWCDCNCFQGPEMLLRGACSDLSSVSYGLEGGNRVPPMSVSKTSHVPIRRLHHLSFPRTNFLDEG